MIACTWQLPIELVNTFRRGLSRAGVQALNAILLSWPVAGVIKVVHGRDREQLQCHQGDCWSPSQLRA